MVESDFPPDTVTALHYPDRLAAIRERSADRAGAPGCGAVDAPESGVTEPADSCRPVALPSGETVLVRGAEPLSERGVAALAELVEVVRSQLPDPDPAAADLYRRLDVARRTLDPPQWRHLAQQAGVPATILTRLANGVMPNAGQFALLEAWLSAQSCAPDPESPIGQ